MNFSSILPTFFVTLREGFEAALVVGIVLACLKRAQQTRLNRSVYLGILAGIFASIAIGLCLGGILQGIANSDAIYAPVWKELLAGGFGLVAVAMLSWMLLWMTQQAKFLKAEVEGTINSAIDNNNAAKGVFILVFIAVLREGFETVLFIAAQFQEGWQIPTMGAIAGLSLATLLGFILFEWGIKINIRLFFQIMGIFLLLIIGGLVIGVLKHFDALVFSLAEIDLNYAKFCVVDRGSCILGWQVWDASKFLPEKQFPGILLKTLFGYRQTLYLAQAIAYVLFLVGVGGTYFWSIVGVKTQKSVVSN
jgi:high-affinity iron transporter